MKCAVGTFARAICSSSAEVSTPVTSNPASTSALVNGPAPQPTSIIFWIYAVELRRRCTISLAAPRATVSNAVA